ncbi:MAG: 2-phospho-L-lactate guanylyltransferase [Chloroflexi bacterium]|nr:2-phospho-L-lactate guanylyltransferase [Chloroflexota bacterium]
MMTSHIVAVIPAKRLADAKSRLADALAPDERSALSLRMLLAVARTIATAPEIRAWAIVSAAPEALAVAQALGGQPIEEPQEGLNVALQLGREWALAQGATGLLVVPSDVPLLTAADISAVAAAAPQADVVIAPSNDEGTNALLLQPPDAIPFRFGRRSAAYHRFEATKRGLRVQFVHSPTLAFDVDTPDDCAAYLREVLVTP